MMSRRPPLERVEMVVDARGAPAVFRWRGRRYVVRSVLANWVEAAPWWAGGIPSAGAGGQHQVWRVDAVGSTGAGVYDLRWSSPRMHVSSTVRSAEHGDASSSSWWVERVLD